MSSRRTASASFLLALVCVCALAAGCTGGGQAEGVAMDPERLQLLSALTDGLAARGVYVFETKLGEDLSPGSLLAPVIGASLLEADLVVETGAPPVNLALGVPEGDVPPGARRVGDVLVTGAPGDVAEVEPRLRETELPPESLMDLAAVTSPVAWGGPPPVRQQLAGHVVITMDEQKVRLVWHDADVMERSAVGIAQALAEGGPPQSPGKRWDTLLLEPKVTVEGDDLIIEAGRGDLPGTLLRQLVDSKALGFLAAG